MCFKSYVFIFCSFRFLFLSFELCFFPPEKTKQILLSGNDNHSDKSYWEIGPVCKY